MRKLNNKGFAISTVLYSLLVMATLVLFLLLGNLSFERRSTDDLVSNIEDELNSLFGNQSLQDPNLLSTSLLLRVGENGNTYNDGTDTFITGENPNNYVLYSNKIWRAVLINNTTKTVKLVTEDIVSSMTFSSAGDTNFANSEIKTWLNNTNTNGFLGSLKNYQNFIVTNSEWYIEVSFGNARPEGTVVNSDVGLLNNYEFKSSHHDSSASNSYLVNNKDWWTLTRWDVSPDILVIGITGGLGVNAPTGSYGVRPVINLKSSIRIVSGDGTASNPYKLEGDS